MPDHFLENSNEPIWAPSPERIEQSNIQQFIKHINIQQYSLGTYEDLHNWSVEQAKEFWLEVWQFCDVIGYRGDCVFGEGTAKWQSYTPARDTVWFPQAQLNYAENLLAYSYQNPSEVAIYFQNERKEKRQITWQKLCDQVSVVQQWLKEQGVVRGDVVTGYLPHMPEAVIAMLATTSLGAIWSSTSPDFGVESVVERFGQVKPKVMFCVNGYSFNGKPFDMTEKNQQIFNRIESLSAICQIDYFSANDSQTSFENEIIEWNTILANYLPHPVIYERVSFNDPLFVLYSSGTTGKPKCIVHSVGGTVLNHLKEHQLHCDIQPNDNVFYYTTCGWMMWNWHVSVLASGASLVIYDGSPMYPNTDALWKLASEAEVSLFGTSAKYLEALQKSGYVPNTQVALPKLKTLCSTGSVLYPEQFDYVYSAIKPDLHLASISGGTDICGCFAIGNPISPVYRGEAQSAALGMNVQAFDQTGQAVIEQRGELVCSNSFPNQPIGFWHDNGERYHSAYWDRFENTWHHGDDVKVTANGGFVFYGRSDTTLNPGGVRIGTGEIYQQVNQLPCVKDSIAVARQVNGDEQIVLFVQLDEVSELTDELKQQIKLTLKEQCSPRHVPAEIYAISDVPRTKSGKLVELAVKQIIHGQEVKNMGAIANPWVLDEVKGYA